MDKLKKISVVALGLCALPMSVWAQYEMVPFKIGVKAGLNVSNYAKTGYDARCGFNAGVDAMFDFSHLIDDTYLRANCLFTLMGASYEVPATTKYMPVYMSVPIRYGYGYVVTPGTALFLETGPYFSLGIAGKVKYDYDSDSNGKIDYLATHEEDFFDDGKRFDMGWGAHCGVILDKQHQISAGFDWGFLNVFNRTGRNRNFMLSYTYFIK